MFRDAAAAAGIHYAQGHGKKRPLTILETIGSGCAFLDYDQDGWLDILLVGQPRCALYRNRRDGTFEDITQKTGLDRAGHWLGCAVGDIDGDGYPDLYISGYQCGALYRNNRGAGFTNVTSEWGIKPHGWETSGAFFDATGSGKVDLFVGRYVEFTPESRQFCPAGDVTTACGPIFYPPQFSSLYLNRGGWFEDHSSALQGQQGKCLGAACAAYDGSGRPSIALANDLLVGDLFRNKGGGQFENAALAAGTAFNTNGLAQSGMGEDWGDYNNDGFLDLAVNNFHNEPTSLYTSIGGKRFVNNALQAGLQPTMSNVKFGIRFLDYDNDGFLDLVISSGHVLTGVDRGDATQTYPEQLLLLRNDGNGKFTRVERGRAGAPFANPLVGRGLAVGDYDNDGKLDLLIVDSEGSALLLHNEGSNSGHWLQIDLEGAHAPRNGEGAIVRLAAGDKRLMRNVTTSGSYLSANPGRVHFGLGAAAVATDVVVEWPWGSHQRVGTLTADAFWKIRQGAAPVRWSPRSPGGGAAAPH